MENLNAENIINEIQSLIKALKDCGGWVKRGNGEGWFNHEILADALALINSQEQRIKEITEENERLRAIPEQLHKEMSERMVEEVKTAKKYTVLIMQSEINKTLSALCKGDVSEIHRIIDQIAKEMLEGENEN